MLTSPGWRGPVRQAQVLVVFTLALMLGGLTTAGTLLVVSGLLSPLDDRVRLLALGVVAVAALLRDFDVATIRLPENRRLIPESVFRRHPLSAAVQFGFELGTGVRTYLPASSAYMVGAALALLTPTAPEAAAAGLAFGAGRALMAWSRYLSASPRQWDARLAASERWLVRGSVVLVLLGGWTLA